MKVAFIGLGVMGFPMAGHLANAGLDVCVYNRTTEKAQKWAETYSGRYAMTPALAAVDADMVFVCVGNDMDVREVTLGKDGALNGMSPGSVLVDHTTTSAELALALDAACQEQRIAFMDAPVSGGQAGAEQGQLTIMCGADDVTYNRVEPVLSHYARFSQLIGPVGQGQMCKMVNQICIAGVVQGLAEGLSFAKAAGLDGEKVIKTIAKGAAGSWQMENRYQTMLNGEYDFGFAVDWMRKDLGIALDAAADKNVSLPLTALVDQFYQDVQNLGGGRFDTSSLLYRLEALKKPNK